MKKLLTFIIALMPLAAYAHWDRDSETLEGHYIQHVDLVDEISGFKFSIKSYDPCTVALMSSADIRHVGTPLRLSSTA